MEIDEFTGQVSEFGGGWDAYVEEREAARRRALDARAGYEIERSRLVDGARQQAGVGPRPARSGRRTRGTRRTGTSTSSTGASRARSGWARAPRRSTGRSNGWTPTRPTTSASRGGCNWRSATAPRAGAVVVDLRGAVVARGSVTLGPFDLTVGWAERIRLAGPNGSGKTTLVDALLGREPLRAGSRYRARSVVFGELDQSRRVFATDEPVVDVVRAAVPDLAGRRRADAAGEVPPRGRRGAAAGRAALAR